MCGKANPPELEECLFCHARLKPPGSAVPAGAEQPAAGGEEGLPDWLKDLRLPEEAFTTDASSESPFMQDREGLDEIGALSEDELPDWLKLVQSSPSDDKQEKVEPKPQESDGAPAIPDWLAEVESFAESVSAGSTEGRQERGEEPLPDWLTGAGPTESESDVPDWLTALSAGKENQADLASTDEAHPAEELPDWVQSLEAVSPPFTEAAKTTGEPQPTGEEPDWLTELLAEAPTPVETTEPLPDWIEESEGGAVLPLSTDLKDLESEELAIPPLVEEPAPQATSSEEPEWLAELQSEELPPAFTDRMPEGTTAAPFDLEGEAPDWLAQLGGEPPEQPIGSIPAFTSDEPDTTPPGPFESEVGAGYLATLPDWVSQVSAEESPVQEAEQSESGLTPAELPDWLQAMRPVEAAAPTVPFEDVSDQEVESAGPLAGLRGVLVASAEPIRHRKPPAYSIKLRVSEDQQARVNLLQDLLAEEEKPRPLPTMPVITTQYFIRLLIAAVLLIPVLAGLLAGGGLVNPPAGGQVPLEVAAFHTALEALPGGAPVLVAFDYEPGFSGELNPTAKLVLSRLMVKNAFLTLVSTSPSGPALAASLIADLNSEPERNQNPYTALANLGYIPGGMMGLLSFAEAPRQVLPYTLDSVDVWNSPGSPISGVESASDFRLVLVMTNNPETARAWIEQVQPFLAASGKPLLMVLSTQAEPLVYPYFRSLTPQVYGMLAGFTGGVTYAELVGRPGFLGGVWDAFSLSFFVTALLVLVAGVIGIGAGLRSNQEKDRG
jgi:hypothetical protein